MASHLHLLVKAIEIKEKSNVSSENNNILRIVHFVHNFETHVNNIIKLIKSVNLTFAINVYSEELYTGIIDCLTADRLTIVSEFEKIEIANVVLHNIIGFKDNINAFINSYVIFQNPLLHIEFKQLFNKIIDIDIICTDNIDTFIADIFTLKTLFGEINKKNDANELYRHFLLFSEFQSRLDFIKNVSNKYHYIIFKIKPIIYNFKKYLSLKTIPFIEYNEILKYSELLNSCYYSEINFKSQQNNNIIETKKRVSEDTDLNKRVRFTMIDDVFEEK